MLVNMSKLKVVSNLVSLKILPMFFHLQEATLSTPTWAGFETALLLKIVSKDSIASTSAREGSSLTNHREVTLATSRHEEKKRIHHHEPAIEYPEVAHSHKVSKNKLNQVCGSKPRRSLSHLSLGLVGLFISL
jgi:hypothetical protein